MKKRILLSILGLALLLPLPILAIETHRDDVVFVDKDQVIDRNYYATGNTIQFYGEINGDLYLAGQDITIDSTNINGDVFVAGNNIIIKGTVNGSVRVAGQYVKILGEVRDNVLFFGQVLNVEPEATIGGHVSSWGQQVNMHGQIDGQLEGGMETLLISGGVGKNVDVILSSRNKETGGLTISDSVVIGGELKYKSFTEGEISEAAEIILGVNFEEMLRQAESAYDKSYFWGLVVKFFMMLVVGMVLLYIWPKFFSQTYQSIKHKPLKYLLWGLMFLIVTPIVSVILMITVIGLPLGFMVLALWVMSLCLAKVMAAWIVGNYLKDKALAKYKWSAITTLAFGILIYLILGQIPVVGWVLTFILFLMAWGSWKQIFQRA